MASNVENHWQVNLTQTDIALILILSIIDNLYTKLLVAADPLERGFTGCLALLEGFPCVVAVAVGVEERIVCRRPLTVVHAIHDAPQLPGVVPQDTI